MDAHRVLIRVELAFGDVRPPTHTLALVDTGSTYNLIDAAFAMRNLAKYDENFEAVVLPPLVLGDGVSCIQPLGILRAVEFAFIDDKKQPLVKVSDYVVIRDLQEKVVIGHQFFIESHEIRRESPRPQPKVEISYARQCLLFGRIPIPWRYETTNVNPNSRFLVCHADTILPPSAMTSVLSEFPGRSLEQTQAPWGFFSNVCPPGTHVNFIESFGSIAKSGNTPVWFSNSSLKAITLPKGLNLCLFEELNEAEYGVYSSGMIKPAAVTETMIHHSPTHPNITDLPPTLTVMTGSLQRVATELDGGRFGSCSTNATASHNLHNSPLCRAQSETEASPTSLSSGICKNSVVNHEPDNLQGITCVPIPQAGNPLAGICTSSVVIDELSALQDPSTCHPIPDYFVGDEISDDKLPPYLRGLRIKVTQCHLTKAEINLLIYYCCVSPPGRDKLFSPENIPGRVDDFKVLVDIADKTPWQSRLIPCSPSDKDEIEKLLNSYTAQGMIEPCHGPFSCSVILVRKDNGRHKIACCLNALNARSRKNTYPVPLIRDNLDALAGRQFLTAIDICGGYLSMVLAEEDRDYFGFITSFGLFRWKRVPYGWRNAGSNFCYLIDTILRGLKYQILVSYVDDVIIYGGRTFHEHLRCVKLTLDRLQAKGMRLAISKCSFSMKTFDYLGFQVSREGIQPCAKNVDKIMGSTCNSLADIRHFVGLIQFYRRWIAKFSQTVAPLYAALKGKWADRDAPALSAAINYVKTALSTYPILRHPDFSKEFFLATDGSLEGFGAILHQKCSESGKLFAIAYASTRLPPSMKKLVGPQLEAAAACWAMNKYRHYLIGRKFTLMTDQEVMKYMSKSSDPPKSIAASVLESMEFDYAVVHVPGTQNGAPDFLSRVAARTSDIDQATFDHQERVYMKMYVQPEPNPEDVEFQNGYDNPAPLSRDDWEQGQASDPRINGIRTHLLANDNDPCVKFHCIHQDLVCYGRPPIDNQRIVVPHALWSTVYSIVHDKLGHRGVKPIISNLAQHFYWPGMTAFIRRAVRGCLDCRRRKDPRLLSAGLTQSVMTSKPWQVLYVDFLGKQLPKSAEGYEYALIIMDGFTRYPFAIALKTKRAEEIAERLLSEVLSVAGLPICVHSDNEATLVSEAFRLAFAKLGVIRTTSSIRHPQGNSPAERFMRYLNSSLAITINNYREWPKMLPMSLFAYRVLPHETTGYSPFFMMFGREPLLPLHASTMLPSNISPLTENPASAIDKMVERMASVFELVRRRQDHMSRVNADRRDMNESRFVARFHVGDPVLIWDPESTSGRTTFARQDPPPTDLSIPQKWTLQWSGPHPIVAVDPLNENIYRFYHIRRKMVLTANVCNIRLFHPFLEIPYSGVPQESRRGARENANPTDVTPLRTLKGPIDAHQLKEGDMFLAELPSNGYEPIAVLQFLSCDGNGSIVCRWWGAYKLTWYLNTRLRTGHWHSGWFDPQDKRMYFQERQHKKDDVFLTNLHTLDEVTLANVIIFDFKLRKDLCLPRLVAQTGIRRYRKMEIDHLEPGKGPTTFEDGDDDGLIETHPSRSKQRMADAKHKRTPQAKAPLPRARDGAK
jgi:transposase InsO family protein